MKDEAVVECKHGVPLETHKNSPVQQNAQVNERTNFVLLCMCVDSKVKKECAQPQNEVWRIDLRSRGAHKALCVL